MGGLGVRYAILITADYILLDVLCGVADCFEKDNVHVPVGGVVTALMCAERAGEFGCALLRHKVVRHTKCRHEVEKRKQPKTCYMPALAHPMT